MMHIQHTYTYTYIKEDKEKNVETKILFSHILY